MANTKSAKKRIRQTEKRRVRNRIFRSSARTYVKRARRMIENGELAEAEGVIPEAVKALDKAAQKGIIHKNKAARDKSRLLKAFHRAQAGQ
ncbi:MAG: 30S ribosomal protein S20 [Anaerolineae bacterium]